MLLLALKLLIINILLALSTLIPQEAFSMGFVGRPISFLPSEIQSDTEKTISNLLFRKLFKYEEGELIPDLVDSWSANEENTEYTIKIKDDVFWQDGTKINSDDVLYSLTSYSGLRSEIEVEKLDNRTVLIRLPTPNAVLPTLLTFGIEPSHLENQSKLQPIGSTSYRVARVVKERQRTDGVVLQSFQKGKQYNRLIFRFYDTEADLSTAYNLGEIKAFLSNSTFNEQGITTANITYMGRYFSVIFNTEKEKLKSPELREKLYTALDIDTLLQRNYYTNSTKAQGAISHSIYTKPEMLENRYDSEIELTQAEKTVLAEIEIILPNNQDGRQIETFLKTYWADALGIKLEIEYQELDELINTGREGDFQVMFIGHETTPDPDRYSFWHSTQIGNLNFARFTDLRADKALEEGRKFKTQEERTKHYNIFQDVMLDKNPAIFLYHPGQFFYISEKTPISLPTVIYNPSEVLNNL